MSIYLPRPAYDVTFYGADPEGVQDSLAAFLEAQSRVDSSSRRARIRIPEGTYRFSARFALTVSDCIWDGYGAKILQGGTLGATESSALWRITGNRNELRGLEFDGNVAQAYAGYSRMIQVNGTTAGTGIGNILRDLYLHDSYNDPLNDQGSDLIQVVNGVDTLSLDCRCDNAGWNGIRMSGDGNRAERCRVNNYLGRGIRMNQGRSAYVIGCTVKTEGISSGAGILCDPEDTVLEYFECVGNYVYVKSERVFDVGGEGTNALKVARVKLAILRDNDIEIGVDSYSTGTIEYDHTGGANENQVTLSGGTWPTYAKSPARLFVNGTFYNVLARISDSIITLKTTSNPGADIAAGATFYLAQKYDNIGIRLEDGVEKCVITGGNPDQILMTNGLLAGMITGAANNGSGKVRFTQVGHQYWVPLDPTAYDGRLVFVSGSGVVQYNTKHVFTAVDADHWDSNIDYVAGTIGSLIKAHGGTDELDVSDMTTGRQKHTNLIPMENIQARICRVKRVHFDLRYDQALNDAGVKFDSTNAAGANSAIEWKSLDGEFDLFEVEDCRASLASVSATGRLITVEDTATQLIAAGRTRGKGNSATNIRAGGVGVVANPTGNANRSMLFDTRDGRTFYGTAAPTAGTWSEGMRVINTSPGTGVPNEWVYRSSGWRWGAATLAVANNVANVDATAINLLSYAIPSGLMGRTGDRISLFASIQWFNAAVTKKVRLLYGATSMWATNDVSSGAGARFVIRGEWVRKADATVDWSVTYIEDGTDVGELFCQQGVATTWDAGTTFNLEADAGVGAAAGEIELRSGSLTFTPAV